MDYIDHVLSHEEIFSLHKQLGRYAKITADITRQKLVIGSEYHADGEEILLKKGSSQKNIWGGGINFEKKEIDTIAFLNLRPTSGNLSMDILDPERREKFISIVKKIFGRLWEK